MSKCCWSRATETLNINSFRYYIQECHQGAAPLAACSVACLSCLRFIGATRVSPTSKNVFLVSWPNKGEAKTSNLWVIFETNGLKTNFLLLTILVCLFDLGFRYYIQECHQGAALSGFYTVACMLYLRFVGQLVCHLQVYLQARMFFFCHGPTRGMPKHLICG